jgi:hypothetical protein
MELVEDPRGCTLFAMHGIVRTDIPKGSEAAAPSSKSASAFVPAGEVTIAPGWRIGPAVAQLKGVEMTINHGDVQVKP